MVSRLNCNDDGTGASVWMWKMGVLLSALAFYFALPTHESGLERAKADKWGAELHATMGADGQPRVAVTGATVTGPLPALDEDGHPPSSASAPAAPSAAAVEAWERCRLFVARVQMGPSPGEGMLSLVQKASKLAGVAGDWRYAITPEYAWLLGRTEQALMRVARPGELHSPVLALPRVQGWHLVVACEKGNDGYPFPEYFIEYLGADGKALPASTPRVSRAARLLMR